MDQVTFTAGAVSRPSLSTALTGSTLKITWPDTATNFNLQYKTNLPDAAWQVVPANTISNEPGHFYLNVNAANGSRFYRLATP